MHDVLSIRRAQMVRALRWSAIFFSIFLVITHQVLTSGPLTKIDEALHREHRPVFKGFFGFLIRRLDDLGLRGVTAFALLTGAIFIAQRFRTWRPLNLAVLSIIALNLVVGSFKYLLGRTKPKVGIDLLHAGGMSYPSGHASNAILIWGVLAYLIYRYAHVDRYRGRLASAGVALISLTVCVVSLIRDTHWFSDLLGGLFIGGALLVLVIAVDRYFPSDSQLS
jgi:membrane-associated phospholipid phosphatase